MATSITEIPSVSWTTDEAGEVWSPGVLKHFEFDPACEPPAEEAIFEGLLAKGDLAVWIGREKHRKSNLALQLAVCAALARDFLWLRFAGERPMRVVLVDYESKSGSLHRRYGAVAEAMNLGPEERESLRQRLTILEVRRLRKAGKYFPGFPTPADSKKSKTDHTQALKFWKGLVKEYPADLYLIDPMRCFHAADENDSAIESLLASIVQHFAGATVILTHHMRKPSHGDSTPLSTDMRGWSDGARGSSAIKAHADVIICQERTQKDGDEVLHFGAFAKDVPDIEPIKLEESGNETFFWQRCAEVPTHLKLAFEALKEGGGVFRKQNDAIRCLVGSGTKSSTAYKHLGDLKKHGLLVMQDDGTLELRAPQQSVRNCTKYVSFL
jgi:hypothetical protein